MRSNSFDPTSVSPGGIDQMQDFAEVALARPGLAYLTRRETSRLLELLATMCTQAPDTLNSWTWFHFALLEYLR